MSTIRMVACIALSLVLLVAFRAEGSTEVIKSADRSLTIYQIDDEHGCAVSIQLNEAGPNAEITLAHSPLSCIPTVEGDNYAIKQLLNAANEDRIVIREFRTFKLGRIRQIEWKRQVIDCYLKKSVRIADANPLEKTLPVLLERCGAFSSLIKIFEEFGAKIDISDIEKVEVVDLRDVAQLKKEGLGDEWIRSHGNIRVTVPIGGVVFFRISPIRN